MLSLKWKDLFKGLIVSVVTAVLTVIQTSLSAGSLTFNWKEIGTVALTATIAYLTKNFFTDDVKEAKQTLTDHAEKTQTPIFINPKSAIS